MSHLSHSFSGLWHLMTAAESVPLLGPGAAALAEVAKKPGDLSAAVVIGTKTLAALIDAHPDMLAEDKNIILSVFAPALAHLKTLADELGLIVNGSPARPGHPGDPASNMAPIPGVDAVPGDPSKAAEFAAATKAYMVAEAAVKSAIAAIA